MAPALGALVPHPPLLLPELAPGAEEPVERLRQACRRALEAVAGATDQVVLVGDGTVWGLAAPGASGTFAPYGAAVQVELPAAGRQLSIEGLPEPASLTELPLSLAVAAWLLRPHPQLHVTAFTVPASLPAGAAAAVGHAISAATGDGAAIVALGDLSACRTVKAPGALHPAAAAFDAGVRDALAAGDLPALRALDPALASEVLAPARAPVQVLAGALEGTAPWHGEVLYDDAPYGVGYVDALLSR